MKKYFILTATLLHFLPLTIFASFIFKPPLLLETIEVDFINKTGDIIEGEYLDIEFMGGKSIAVFDTLLMVVTSNPEALLQVYDTRTLEPLAMLCQQGRAKNEFTNNSIYELSNQTFQRNGDVIVMVRGEGGYVIKEINITASIREGKTIVEGINNKIPYGCGDVYGINNELTKIFVFNNHNYSLDREEFNPPTFSIIDEQDSEVLEIYGRLVDFENKAYSTFWYNNNICKHPTKNIFVQCMNTMDYIHFIDLDNKKYYSIHQNGSPTFDEVYIPNKITNGVYEFDSEHFYESIPAEDYFLVFFTNGDYRKKSIKNGNIKAAELLAFDWNGNYLGGVKMDILAQDYTYDSNNMILYGYRIFDEKIIAYDLSEFVNSFAK